MGPSALAVGAAAVFAALTLVARELLRGAPVDQAAALAERTLAGRGWKESFVAALTAAGVTTGPGELCLLVAAAALGAGLVGTLLGGVVLGLLFLLGAPAVAHLVVKRRARQRREAFAEQVVVVLPSLAASLRAGHSLTQAIELAGRELDGPAGDELRRAAAEILLGRDLVSALDAVAERYDCEDLRWVVSALQIHREVGGDLARVLDRVADTIRARDHLRRQVRTLTAEGRASAKVLSFLPIGLAVLLAVVSPSYVDTFTGSGTGLALLALVVVLIAGGMAWLRTVGKVVA